MHPIFFTIAGKPIHFYQVVFPLTILFGILLSTRRAKKEGFREEDMLAMFVFVIVGMVVCARLLDVLGNFSWYALKPSRLFNRQTGVVLLGGYIGAIAGGWGYLRYKKIPFLPVVDIPATYFGLFLAFHRTFACFMAGCCFGSPTALPWGVTFPAGSLADKIFGQVPVHPTQLYEALLGLAMFGAMLLYRRKKDRLAGQLFALQLVLYGIGRFFIEFARGDKGRGAIWLFSTSQWVSLAMIAVFMILTIDAGKRRRLAYRKD